MSNIVTYAEFQFRRGQQELDRCRRIAQGMIEREQKEAEKLFGGLALEDWLEAGNGRKTDDDPEAA